MGSKLATMGPSLRRKVWHTFRGILDIFHLLPGAAAIVICMLLAADAQVHELYLSYLAQPDPIQISCAVVGFSMVSFALYASHYLLSSIRRNIIYANFVRPNIGGSLRWIRWFFGLFWAFLPWLGLAIGLVLAAVQVWQDQLQIERALEELQERPAQLFSGSLIVAPTAAVGFMVVVAAVVLLLLNSFRESRVMLYVFWSFIILLMALAAFIPGKSADFIAFYRHLGPLATLSIEILFVFTTLTAIAWLSQQSKFPAVTLVAATIVIGALFDIPFSRLTAVFGVVCFLLLVVAVLAQLKWEALILAALCILSAVAYHRDAASTDKLDPNQSDAKQAPLFRVQMVRQSFDDWLSKRPDLAVAAAAHKKYPVFIIAAQGGGIYAAASAALFLARLQDSAPCFADHVFAISGVSGGAIGASIFQALARQPAAAIAGTPPAKCAPDAGGTDPKTPLTDKIMRIMEDDHFSPVVSAIIPDLLGEQWGRAETLERGFIDSVDRSDPSAAARLRDWYINHWDQGANPALVLNTTSAETGYRVAFAPFGLSGSSDRSLYSFADNEFVTQSTAPDATGASAAGTSGAGSSADLATGQSGKNGVPGQCLNRNSADNAAGGRSAAEKVLLMFGAVASARFPFILPPYSTSNCGNRLNFVDGGYADNSGAETALDLYRAIEPEDQSSSDPVGAGPNPAVDIKLILITSDDPLPDFRQINGTKFGDTVAPISAILQVRKGLGDQAVARVCDYFRQAKKNVDENCSPLPGKPWQLDLVKIQDQVYGLPLGWKISDATVNLISSLIGRSASCRESAAPEREARDILSNSCVLRNIEQTLRDFRD